MDGPQSSGPNSDHYFKYRYAYAICLPFSAWGVTAIIGWGQAGLYLVGIICFIAWLSWPDKKTYYALKNIADSNGLKLKRFVSVQGKVDGRKVEITFCPEDNGDNPTPERTLFEFQIKGKLPKKLRIGNQLAAHEFDKKMGLQDIEVDGNPFDKNFLVMGKNDSKIKSYLTKERQKALIELRKSSSDLDIKKGWLYLDVTKKLSNNPNKIKRLFLKFKELVKVLDPTQEEVFEYTYGTDEAESVEKIQNRKKYRLYVASITFGIALYIFGFVGIFIYEYPGFIPLMLALKWVGIPTAALGMLAFFYYLVTDTKKTLKSIMDSGFLFGTYILIFTVAFAIFLPISGYIAHVNAWTAKAPVHTLQRQTSSAGIGRDIKQGGLGFPYCYSWEDCKF